MKYTPILFSTEMVQAILNGSKTQTRRIMKPQLEDCNHQIYTEADWKTQPSEFIVRDGETYCRLCGNGVRPDGQGIKCPYGQVGDILWVRETWQKYYLPAPENEFPKYAYKADENTNNFTWKSSIHMPKEACRLFLRIKSIRVERLQNISIEDCIAEGSPMLKSENYHYKWYEQLWRLINGTKSWESNPWVWVVEFERIEKPENWLK